MTRFCAMFISHVNPTHVSADRQGLLGDARLFSIRPPTSPPSPSARRDTAIACGRPSLFASPLDLPAVVRPLPPDIRGPGSRLDRHRTGDAVRLAGIERHQQVTHAELHRADHVHEEQSGRRRPAGVHPQQCIGIDLVGRPSDETQSAPPKPCAPPQQRQQCGAGASRHIHVHARQHGANQLQAAIDVPADQELLGSAPLELDALADRPAPSAARRYASAASAGRPALASAWASPSFHAAGVRATPGDSASACW